MVIDFGSGMAHYSLGILFVPLIDDQHKHTFIYNLVAFGLQPVYGFLIDKWKLARYAVIAGCLLVGTALLLVRQPLLANTLGPLGNALYHIGAGVIVWRMFPGKAWPLGVLIGPGAIGISMSNKLAGELSSYIAPVLACLMFLAMAVALWPNLRGYLERRQIMRMSSITVWIILLLLLSTAIRSYGAMNMNFPWKSAAPWGLMLMFAAAFGKMAGGFATDYFGRIRASAIALIIAAPLVAWGKAGPGLGVTGAFLFQTTMAVTLLALYEQMPEYPGFAFGMLCFGLWIGVLLKQVLAIDLPSSPLWQLGLILISCAALTIALWLNGRVSGNSGKDQRREPFTATL
jgi:FSR family fosmidomycin resistance protein-like MFS transporter